MNKLEVFDSIMLFWDDPRIPPEALAFFKIYPHNSFFSYQTCNIYLCKWIKNEARAWMKILKSKGMPSSFYDIFITVLIRKLNHENMHRVLYKTISKEAAVYYDKLFEKQTYQNTNGIGMASGGRDDFKEYVLP